ncbi:MATE family efflux transporter, partial [Pseudomonas aeruginosa]
FAHDILELLGTDPKVMHLSLPYVQWMLAGSPLLFVYIIYTSILRGVGDSTTPLLALALTSVIGVIITPILLKGYFGFPALGIIAPAIASIISYIAILIFLAIYLNKKKHPLRPNRQLLQHIRHNSALS